MQNSRAGGLDPGAARPGEIPRAGQRKGKTPALRQLPGCALSAGGRGLRLRHAGRHAFLQAGLTCTDSGGPLEFITDGTTGIVAAPDPAEIGRGDGASRRRTAPAPGSIGRAAREDYLRRDITWEAVVEKLLLRAMKIAWFSPLLPGTFGHRQFHRASPRRAAQIGSRCVSSPRNMAASSNLPLGTFYRGGSRALSA